MKLTKNVDSDKYGYPGYDIGFGARSTFLLLRGGFDQNVIFRFSNSSSVHCNNRKKSYISSW